MKKKDTKKLVAEIRAVLLKDFFKQVKDIAKPGLHTKGHKLMGFILASLMIDYLAGFYAGVTLATIHKDSGTRYKDFVKKYLPQYNADHLWRDVRSRLVHNYSVGGGYGFTHMEEDGKHFEIVAHSNGKNLTVLNLEDFLKDVENATKSYLNDLSAKPLLQSNAKQRRTSIGLIAYIPTL